MTATCSSVRNSSCFSAISKSSISSVYSTSWWRIVNSVCWFSVCSRRALCLTCESVALSLISSVSCGVCICSTNLSLSFSTSSNGLLIKSSSCSGSSISFFLRAVSHISVWLYALRCKLSTNKLSATLFVVGVALPLVWSTLFFWSAVINHSVAVMVNCV